MLATFDPAVIENYPRIFDEPALEVQQDKLSFTEPLHDSPEFVLVEEAQESIKDPEVYQFQMSFSEPLHYA